MNAYILLWLRYSAFLVLYPVGSGSELGMVALALSQVCTPRRQTPGIFDEQPAEDHAAACCKPLMLPAADPATEAADLGASQCTESVFRLLHSLHRCDAGLSARYVRPLMCTCAHTVPIKMLTLNGILCNCRLPTYVLPYGAATAEKPRQQCRPKASLGVPL
jgi:Protein tyrosine phosphatase-like protein, PTPLA